MISADANMLALMLTKSVGEKPEGSLFVVETLVHGSTSTIRKRIRISKELLASLLIKDPRGLL